MRSLLMDAANLDRRPTIRFAHTPHSCTLPQSNYRRGLRLIWIPWAEWIFCFISSHPFDLLSLRSMSLVVYGSWLQDSRRAQAFSRVCFPGSCIRRVLAEDWRKGKSQEEGPMVARIMPPMSSTCTLISLDPSAYPAWEATCSRPSKTSHLHWCPLSESWYCTSPYAPASLPWRIPCRSS